MHPKVLSENAWRTVRALSSGGWLDSWILAGETGLALHLGHRYSEHLDLFGEEPFEPSGLADALSRAGRVRVQQSAADTLHVELNGLRVSFLRIQTPFLFPGSAYRRLTVADPRDIAVMKVVAIGGRGSRKDFLDLFFYLRSGGSLAETLSLLEKRYHGVDFNTYHALKSLVYFEDAEEEPMPRMIKKVEWDGVKEFLISEVRRLS
jgi:hypothetical protein